MFGEVKRAQFGIPNYHKTSTNTEANYFKCKLPTASKEVGQRGTSRGKPCMQI